MNAVVRTSSKAADIPGNPFKTEVFARDVTYFIAYVDEEPVAQEALFRKGNLWWVDYLFIREDMRGNKLHNLIRDQLLPFAAEITDYTFANCQNMAPEDLLRSVKRYGPIDILNTGYSGRKPVTFMRRHISQFRKSKTR